jgi:hypothetical protein
VTLIQAAVAKTATVAFRARKPARNGPRFG